MEPDQNPETATPFGLITLLSSFKNNYQGNMRQNYQFKHKATQRFRPLNIKNTTNSEKSDSICRTTFLTFITNT